MKLQKRVRPMWEASSPNLENPEVMQMTEPNSFAK